MIMVTEISELKLILDDIIELLTDDGETHWLNYMVSIRERLENGDLSAIDYLLGTYGGRGSFADLIICQRFEDGRFTWIDGHMEKNARLDDLRSEAHRLAKLLKKMIDPDADDDDDDDDDDTLTLEMLELEDTD
jgi:hypothetical protein